MTAVTWLFNSVDWVFVLMFFLLTWLMTRTFGEFTFLKKWTSNLKVRYIVLISSLVLGIVFYVVYRNFGLPWVNEPKVPYGFSLFLSVVFTMVINEFVGLDVLMDKLFKIGDLRSEK